MGASIKLKETTTFTATPCLFKQQELFYFQYPTEILVGLRDVVIALPVDFSQKKERKKRETPQKHKKPTKNKQTNTKTKTKKQQNKTNTKPPTKTNQT